MRGVWKQCQVSGTFDSKRQWSLTFSAITRFLPRLNTSSIGDKPADVRYVFIIDFGFFTKTLTPAPSSTSECWACTLRCSLSCHFLPRGTDSGTIGLHSPKTPHGTYYQGSSSTFSASVDVFSSGRLVTQGSGSGSSGFS